MTAPIELDVLHSCNHVLCVAKPAGLPTVPDSSGDESLLDRARAWVKVEFAKPGDVFLGVVHRLDRPVSGVVCFARTSKGAARLSESFRSKAARKTYRAITSGVPSPAAGVVEHWLHKDRERNVVTVVGEGARDARLARTEYRVLVSAEGRAHVELIPVTGRAHQLRVAMASLGTPLLGDLKYGATAPLPDQSVALHALRLEVPHPTRDEVLRIEAPLPASAHWRRMRVPGPRD